MAEKRTETLFGGLRRRKQEKAGGNPEPEVVPAPAPVRQPSMRHKTKKIGQTLYLDPAVDDKLDEILLTRKGEISPYTGRRLRKHDLFLEAIDLLFAETGEGSIKSLAERG